MLFRREVGDLGRYQDPTNTPGDLGQSLSVAISESHPVNGPLGRLVDPHWAGVRDGKDLGPQEFKSAHRSLSALNDAPSQLVWVVDVVRRGFNAPSAASV